jgi:uncharacterized protein with NAD-binding domain and iron-sulfur cluster
MGQNGGFTRRQALQRAALGGAALSAGVAPNAFAAARRSVSRGRDVAVLGGGMAGLAAAHELVERGFSVTVYEKKALGGKARSIPVPGTAAGGRRELPGEHGFRFFPGFYHHIPDTMRRTPDGKNPNGVYDNLVDVSGGRSPRTNGRADAQLFGVIPDPLEVTRPGGVQRLIVEEILKQQGVPPAELEFFVNRLLVFLTSCEERRYGQWEKTSWWDFVRAEGKSAEYQKVVASGLTRTVVAAKETVASTRTIGNMGEAFVMNAMQRGNDGALDRVLDAPTNEAWIDPWVAHLEKLGVRFVVGQTVDRLDIARGRVAGARVRDRAGTRRRVDADWFVLAVPAERVVPLLRADVLAAAPELEGIKDLRVDWMNGIQYYLRETVDIAAGHISFVDAPWALTALTQGQFWAERDWRRDYGDGTVADCLSVDISDWDSPGMFNRKPAKECTAEEIAVEVWKQIKAHLEDTGEVHLPDEILHSWFLDPGIQWDPVRRRNSNDEPLLVNTVGSWEKRPDAGTQISNLVVAGDYVRTNIDLATMEGANESGREACNVLLDRSGSKAAHAAKFTLYDPPEFAALKAVDRELWKAGRRNALDNHP